MTSTKPQNVKALIERLKTLPNPDAPNKELMSFFDQETDCGTVGCIAGEALLLCGLHPSDFSTEAIVRRAVEFIGTEHEDAEDRSSAFFMCYWPADLRKQYEQATTLGEERAAMIARLERLLP
jgi:hypothetical protein